PEKRHTSLAPRLERVALEQLVEADILGTRRGHDVLEWPVKAGGGRARDGCSTTCSRDVACVQADEPVHVALRCPGNAGFDSTSQILRPAHAGQMADCVSGHATNADEAARMRGTFAGMKLPANPRPDSIGTDKRLPCHGGAVRERHLDTVWHR